VQRTTKSAFSTARFKSRVAWSTAPIFFTFADAHGTAHEAIHLGRKPPLLDGQPQGAAQQADANQGDFLPVHASE